MIIQNAIVVVADFGMDIRAAECARINFQPIIERNVIREIAIAVDHVPFEQPEGEIAGNIAVNHGNKLILERVDLLALEKSAGIADLYRRTFEVNDWQALAKAGP